MDSIIDNIMNDCYNRIAQISQINKPFDDTFKPYTKEFIKKVIDHFEEKEEYEKCKTLNDFLSIRFDHERGYTI